MIGLTFSGTGNSRYALECFLRELGGDAAAFSIEDPQAAAHIPQHEDIVFSYPVQYSEVPKFLKDFIHQHAGLWPGKKVFIIATMALFSGDGAGVLARLLQSYGAIITGGLHLQMPDSIADEPVLKRSPQRNAQLVAKATAKIHKAAAAFKEGRSPRQGLGFLSRMAGLLTQRLLFGPKTRRYHSGLKVNATLCMGCGKCQRLCPTQNITLQEGKATGHDRCTLCYRCVNACPAKAITLLGKRVVTQAREGQGLCP